MNLMPLHTYATEGLRSKDPSYQQNQNDIETRMGALINYPALVVWMCKHGAYVAGGAVLSEITGFFMPLRSRVLPSDIDIKARLFVPTDIDIWVPHWTVEAAMTELCEMLPGIQCVHQDSKYGGTNALLTAEFMYNGKKFQIVTTMSSVYTTIVNFDIDVCRCAWDPRSPNEFIVLHMPAIKSRRAILRPARDGTPATKEREEARREKYRERGCTVKDCIFRSNGFFNTK